jgi:hypothetical protein
MPLASLTLTLSVRISLNSGSGKVLAYNIISVIANTPNHLCLVYHELAGVTTNSGADIESAPTEAVY